jgi:NAD+ kinase
MKFGIVYKEENQKAYELARRVREYLESKEQTVLGQKNLKDADFIISLGGDGTLIHTACENAPLNIPLVGINTGNLGFLTATESDDWKEAVEKLIKGDYFISDRMTIDASVESQTRNLPRRQAGKKLETYRAVNEVVIKGLYRIVDLEIQVNGEEFLRIVGDGVIVATQTGSTAYSLSAGGPIVDSQLDSLLVTPINPIGLPIPSVVLAPGDKVEVKLAKGDDVSLIIDGQEHTRLSENQGVEISRGKYDIILVYFDKQHFLKSLNGKFGLSGRSVG